MGGFGAKPDPYLAHFAFNGLCPGAVSSTRLFANPPLCGFGTFLFKKEIFQIRRMPVDSTVGHIIFPGKPKIPMPGWFIQPFLPGLLLQANNPASAFRLP